MQQFYKSTKKTPMLLTKHFGLTTKRFSVVPWKEDNKKTLLSLAKNNVGRQ